MAKEIMLGNQLVGKDHPTYIIAEIGINHNGDLNIAKRMIQAAHYAHVNAVKISKTHTEDMCSSRRTNQNA
jgi:N-acetylneuraminate synthase